MLAEPADLPLKPADKENVKMKANNRTKMGTETGDPGNNVS